MLVPTLTLTPDEIDLAYHIGMARHLESVMRNRRPLFGGGDSPDADVLGALGEVAFMLWYERTHHVHLTIDVLRRGTDVGDFEVRTTLPGRRLLVREKDKSNKYFVLVYAHLPQPKFSFPGLMLGREAKKRRYATTLLGDALHAVPAGELREWVKLAA